MPPKRGRLFGEDEVLKSERDTPSASPANSPTPSPSVKKATVRGSPKAKAASKSVSPRVKRLKTEAASTQRGGGAQNGGGSSVEGLKIVLSGEMTQRDHLEGRLKEEGALVRSAVSGVTELLIIGAQLEDGRAVTEGTKYRKARELIDTGTSKCGLIILTEKEFYDKYPQFAPGGMGKQNSGTNAPPLIPSAPDHLLWSERYRPVNDEDFTVNASALAALKQWLSHWHPSLESERAALLSGPPGVGKTSTVHAIAKQFGYKLLEFNASDTRSAKQLKRLYDLVEGGWSLSKGFLVEPEKQMILMDEVDGLSVGDRGGGQELVKIISVSKIPIVCTCNNKQHPKIRTLLKYCRSIPFSKADVPSAAAHVHRILRAEGVADSVLPEDVITGLCEASQGDLRQFINTIQLRVNNAQQQTLKRPPEAAFRSAKDVANYDDAMGLVRRLFNNKSLTGRERLDIYFTDPDMVPVAVFENIYKTFAKTNDPTASMFTTMHIANSLAFGDRINNLIRGQGRWELMPQSGYFSTVMPSYAVGSPLFRIDFPKLLGKISSSNKHKRQLMELGSRTGSGGRRLVHDGFYELLSTRILQPFLNKSTDDLNTRLEQFFDFAVSYNLDTKELVTENLMDVRVHKPGDMVLYDRVDSKTKTALTKAYSTFWVTAAARSTKGKGAKAKGKTINLKEPKKAPAGKGAAGKGPRTPPSGEDEETENPDDEDDDVKREHEEEESRMATIC